MRRHRGNPFGRALPALILAILFADAFVLIHGASANVLWGHYEVGPQAEPTVTEIATMTPTATATAAASTTATPTPTATATTVACFPSESGACPNCVDSTCNSLCQGVSSSLTGSCSPDHMTCNCSF